MTRSKKSVSTQFSKNSSVVTEKSSTSIHNKVDSFDELFKNCCDQENIPCVLDVKKVYQLPLINPFPQSSTSLVSSIKETSKSKTHETDAEVSNNEILVLLDGVTSKPNQIILKHFRPNVAQLQALNKTVQQFVTITTLKLEYCGITNFITVHEMLVNCPNIINVSLRGNPAENENVHLILNDTNILVLSLSSCQLNDSDLKRITKQFDENTELISLNLSSNNITDQGVEYLIRFLRANRTLIHLNLADNFIEDNGCASLMGVLQRFPLNPDEIVFRRKRRMEELKKIGEFMKRYRTSADLLKKPSSSPLIRHSSGSSTHQRLFKSHSARSRDNFSFSSSIKIQDATDNKSQEVVTRDEFCNDAHPFMKNCEPENGEIFCVGNFSLLHLNLTYNKITAKAVDSVFATLDYQRRANNNETVNVKLTGNLLPDQILDRISCVSNTCLSFSSTTSSRTLEKRKKSSTSQK